MHLESKELHETLREKVEGCWAAYREKLLTLPSEQLIDKASEIAAAQFVMNELTESPDTYPDHLLENLLRYDDPLEAMREEWLEGQCGDHSTQFESALWQFYKCGPNPEDFSGMEMT